MYCSVFESPHSIISKLRMLPPSVVSMHSSSTLNNDITCLGCLFSTFPKGMIVQTVILHGSSNPGIIIYSDGT